jgi:cutinase
MALTSLSRRTLRAAFLTAFTTVAAAAGAVVGGPVAAAQPCPDVEVVFARGTGEAPGVGGTGQAFVDAVRAQAGPRTVGVYAVNYPAANNFDDRVRFAGTVVDGIRDEADHVRAMAANCPNTRLVLGGYSQGAVVSGFTTVDSPPAGAGALGLLPAPLTAQEARNVAAVVLFGTPSQEFLSQYGAPALTIGPLFADKTLQLCAQGDTICSGAPDGGPTVAHALYPVNGMVNQGATYAVGRL